MRSVHLRLLKHHRSHHKRNDVRHPRGGIASIQPIEGIVGFKRQFSVTKHVYNESYLPYGVIRQSDFFGEALTFVNNDVDENLITSIDRSIINITREQDSDQNQISQDDDILDNVAKSWNRLMGWRSVLPLVELAIYTLEMMAMDRMQKRCTRQL